MDSNPYWVRMNIEQGTTQHLTLVFFFNELLCIVNFCLVSWVARHYDRVHAHGVHNMTITEGKTRLLAVFFDNEIMLIDVIGPCYIVCNMHDIKSLVVNRSY